MKALKTKLRHMGLKSYHHNSIWFRTSFLYSIVDYIREHELSYTNNI